MVLKFKPQEKKRSTMLWLGIGMVFPLLIAFLFLGEIREFVTGEMAETESESFKEAVADLAFSDEDNDLFVDDENDTGLEKDMSFNEVEKAKSVNVTVQSKENQKDKPKDIFQQDFADTGKKPKVLNIFDISDIIRSEEKITVGRKKEFDKGDILEEEFYNIFNTGTIKCYLADERDFSINLSLNLIFHDQAIEKELYYKRYEIAIRVKHLFSLKNLSEIHVEKLRAELVAEINKTIERGKVERVEFTDFTPVRDNS